MAPVAGSSACAYVCPPSVAIPSIASLVPPTCSAHRLMAPVDGSKCTASHLPNRDELWFWVVVALPQASSICAPCSAASVASARPWGDSVAKQATTSLHASDRLGGAGADQGGVGGAGQTVDVRRQLVRLLIVQGGQVSQEAVQVAQPLVRVYGDEHRADGGVDGVRREAKAQVVQHGGQRDVGQRHQVVSRRRRVAAHWSELGQPLYRHRHLGRRGATGAPVRQRHRAAGAPHLDRRHVPVAGHWQPHASAVHRRRTTGVGRPCSSARRRRGRFWGVLLSAAFVFP
eukprot:scaffold29644_cov89-Isochrysis_galbana.AAC.1